jgi:disulfide oxidoreductase YuzD
MPKNKNAIALLITITFLMAISAIIAFGLKNIQKDITNSTKESFYYQSMIIYEDVKQILLPNIFEQIKNLDTNDSDSKQAIAQILNDYFFLPIPLINDETIGSVFVEIRPVNRGYNINNLKSTPIPQRKFFKKFINNLDDEEFFIDLLDLALETNSSIAMYDYLKNDKSIAINLPFFKRGEIVDFKHFKQIEDEYFKKTKDKKIYDLNWKEFLDFNSGTKVIFSYIKYEYCKTLFIDNYGEEWVEKYCKNEEFVDDSRAVEIFGEDYNQTLYSKNITLDNYTPKILVILHISQNKNRAKYIFRYNIETKEATILNLDFDEEG